MKTMKLGKSDLEITRVGLGTWAMGGPWEFGWGPQDDSDAKKAIIEAMEMGINWIDTAPIYGLGHSEELIGATLRDAGFSPIIATKCGLLWDDQSRKINCLKGASIREECHASLRRLKVEVIDLYQIHWNMPAEDIEEAWGEMVKLRNEGKVRWLGVCNFSVEELERISKIERPTSVQPQYSMVERSIERDILGYCRDRQIGIVAYSPMCRGLLTGNFTRERLAKLASDDHRLRSDIFKEPMFSAVLELVERLRPIAADHGVGVSQIAISWLLHQDGVTAAIVGARRQGQIKETAGAADLELNAETMERIGELLADYQKKTVKIMASW